MALPANVPGIGHETRDRVEQRRLAGAVQSDDRDEFPLMHMERDILQRLRFVIVDTQILDIEKRRVSVAKRGLGARRRLEGAAEIDSSNGLILHDVLNRALSDPLADMHGVNSVDER